MKISRHGPVACWEYVNVFWNSRIERVARLGVAPVYGPIEVDTARIAPDGRLVVPAGAELPFVAAGNSLAVDGTLISQGGSYTLWLVHPPVRVSSRLDGVLPGGEVDARATLRVGYAAGWARPR